MKSLPKKVDYLLAFRGVAVMGVLMGHALGIGSHSLGVYISESSSASFLPNHQHLDPFRDFLFVLTPLLGLNFVILFFVQSGYLMGKVFHDKRYDLSLMGIRQFYSNRFLRIAPLLYFNLAICLMLFPAASFDWLKILGDFLFITNVTDRGINLVTWSLSHEMQYYLLAPFIFFIFGRRISWANLAGCLCVALLGFFILATSGSMWFRFGYALLFGYAVNIFIRYRTFYIPESLKLGALISGVVIINCAYNYFALDAEELLGEFIVAVVSAIAIFVLECPSKNSLSQKCTWYARSIAFWVFTGEITFSIYLWHYPFIISRFGLFDAIATRMASNFGWSHEWQIMAAYHFVELSIVLPITYVVSIATFYLIERRFRPRLYESNEVASGFVAKLT